MSLLDDNPAPGEGEDGSSSGKRSEQPPAVPPLSESACEKIVQAIALALDLRVDRPLRPNVEKLDEYEDPLQALMDSAANAGIALRETQFRSEGETFALVQQGYPVTLINGEGGVFVLQRPEGRQIEVAVVGDQLRHEFLASGNLKRLVGDPKQTRMLVAQRELQCDNLSASPGEHGAVHHGEHPKPLARFLSLLNLDRRDTSIVILFAGVAGVLGLATPLVIESLVNVVSWGIYFQPLLVLAGMLLVCLGIAGVLKILQTWVVEIIQRRQFVRIVSDLAHRFPRANQQSLEGEFPRELANRVFDIMTIQKATAVLLLDGVSIVLTTVLGLFLLAFYHPFLLGFDIVLVMSMIGITWLLGRGGIRTAIKESKTKYAVAHWLQDIIAMPAAFKIGGGEGLAVRRANQLTADYVRARKSQFAVVIRQVIFAVSLQVIASTALLGLGGWLVINGQLTLGQLVASELVVTVVVGAFAKAGKSLEKFYDLMAGIDKVGHLIDVPPDPRGEVGKLSDGPAEVAWSDVTFATATGRSSAVAASVTPGSVLALVGDDPTGKSLLAQAIAGLVKPHEGTVQVGGFNAFETALVEGGRSVGYAGSPEIFHGPLRENVDLGRVSVTQNRIRKALEMAELAETVRGLHDGIDTFLQSEGYPLGVEQKAQLMIARAVANRPKVLVIDGILDNIRPDVRDRILQNLSTDDKPWTLIVVTHHDGVASQCREQLSLRNQN